MVGTAITTKGRVDPEMWLGNIRYGRSAMQGVSDEFLEVRLPGIMQELAGGNRAGPAGTGIMAAFRAIVLAKGQSANIDTWRSLGMLDESKVKKDSRGKEKIMPGGIKGSDLMGTDPDKFIHNLAEALKAHGITERGAMI